MSFIPNGADTREQMLREIGIEKTGVEELFSAIPEELRAKSFDIPEGRSEFEVERAVRELGSRNVNNLVYFTGGGFYDHLIPSAVDSLISRGEFFTAYTPYQPEASQGTLQAIYEYQSCICALTGMDAANASLYDGGTALYEAAMMAVRITGRERIVMDGGVSPIYRKMIKSYTHNLDIEFFEVPVCHGQSDREELSAHITDETAAVILQNPNFFGAVDDHSDIVEHDARSRADALQDAGQNQHAADRGEQPPDRRCFRRRVGPPFHRTQNLTLAPTPKSLGCPTPPTETCSPPGASKGKAPSA